MPDVSRSDSQKSDVSQKPRVSFNRDVHVKRIVPRESARTSGDGAVAGGHHHQQHYSTSPIRRERLDKKTKKELQEEAAKVLHHADRLDCVANRNGLSPEKFYTLPRKKAKKEPDFGSIDRKLKQKNNVNLVPKKQTRATVFEIFKNKNKPTLGRSVSDASALKNLQNKKQLSPIIEVTPREDYFETNKENFDNTNIINKKESVTEQLRKFIEEIDEELYKEGGIQRTDKKQEEQKQPTPVIIDLDKAQKISTPKSNKFKATGLAKKLKSITRKEKKRKSKTNDTNNVKNKIGKAVDEDNGKQLAPRIKAAIESLGNNKSSSEMIHSSQKPVDKLPLTKGRTVDSMVKRLSREDQYQSSSPPPLNKTNILITPHGSVQHNNNQPFSYTRGVSPEKQIIYAQVVCGGTNKRTVHTTFMNGQKKQQHSDSDEGLGNEENLNFHKKNVNYDEVDNATKYEEETPITPKFRNNQYIINNYETTKYASYMDSSNRGRADGMDSKRRTSPTEPQITSLSARRDMLESRITRRLNDNTLRTSPEYLKNSQTQYNGDYYRSGSTSPEKYHKNEVRTNGNSKQPTPKTNNGYHYDSEPKSFDSQVSDYRSSPDYRIYKYKSTPDIVHHYDREKGDGTSREKFVDSGIENDFKRDSSDNFLRTNSRPVRYNNESEDEGFASSLLIASERQHTEDGVNQSKRNQHLEEEYRHRFRSSDYVPRERSIDDGSHYDPRIDKDVKVRNIERKPPKPEKKSGLDKVKSLFSRDGKKKKEKGGQQGMVREESLRARYVEYKGREMLKKADPHNYEYASSNGNNNRRRHPSPSPSPTRFNNNNNNQGKSTVQRNGKIENGGWFKSLERLSRKKSKKEDSFSGAEEEVKPTKNLRFFGDTDMESNDSRGYKNGNLRNRSQSTKDLYREKSPEINNIRKSGHKSMTNILCESDRDIRGSRASLKPPMSPTNRIPRDVSRQGRSRRKNEVSSVESSTEGDSSQQSQRSVVYLHAATVGDIPGPGYLRNVRRAASREELASNSSSRIQPQVKTLSRSFSVLAPWRPRHPREAMDVDYSQYQKKNGKYEQKLSKVSSSRKDSSSTLKKKAQETRKNQSATTLNRKSKSKENISRSREELPKGSNSSTLYKKKERLPRENSRYNRSDKEERKISTKSLSVESLGRRSRDESRDVSRSVSMPRDPEKSAGWFKMAKKRASSSTQRL